MLYYGLEQHSLDSYFQFKELGSTPSTPTTNEIRLYAKDDGSGVSTLCYKNDAGTEICLPSSGTIVTGTGVSGRLAFWNGTSILTSDADLTFLVDTLTATKIIAPTSVTISTFTSGSLVFAGVSGLLSQDNANLFWDDTNNRFGLGTAVPGFQFHGVAPDASSFNFTLDTYGTGAVPNYRSRAARGTLASPSALSTDDLIIAISGLPRGATAFASGARVAIQGFAAENQTDTSQGTYLTFRTTPTGGSVTMAERFRVGPAGQWGIGGATFGTAGQYFRSGGASAAPTWATIDHNTELANVASGDVHTQYALLAGRSGGQVLIGGTASGNSLTLKSTSNATKGNIILETDGAVNPTILVDHYADEVRLRFRRANTSKASPSALLSGDAIGAMQFGGYNSSAFTSAKATIEVSATENWTTTANGTKLVFGTTPNGTTSVQVALIFDQDGSVVIGTGVAALATTATGGFLNIPTCAGAPTGTPTAYTGTVPMVFDTTNNKLYIYNSGWKTTTVFA